MSNPFKIIEPTEVPPSSVKTEVMGSVDSVVMLLRFVQLFAADSTAVVLSKLKVNLNEEETDKQPES